MEHYKKTIGRFGEDAAERYLKEKRYEILARNYLIRGGEIDIIAKKGGYVVFVEVKTRKDKSYGTAAEAVTYTKQQRMQKAAAHFLLSYGETDARFDVIEVYGHIQQGAFCLQSLSHIQNAF